MKTKRRESGATRAASQAKAGAKHRKPTLAAVRREFHQQYPLVDVDESLLKLVGIDPPLDIRSEKRSLREAVMRADRK